MVRKPLSVPVRRADLRPKNGRRKKEKVFSKKSKKVLDIIGMFWYNSGAVAREAVKRRANGSKSTL